MRKDFEGIQSIRDLKEGDTVTIRSPRIFSETTRKEYTLTSVTRHDKAGDLSFSQDLVVRTFESADGDIITDQRFEDQESLWVSFAENHQVSL